MVARGLGQTGRRRRSTHVGLVSWLVCGVVAVGSGGLDAGAVWAASPAPSSQAPGAPTVAQIAAAIVDEARAGADDPLKLEAAERALADVLRDHPRSAAAHRAQGALRDLLGDPQGALAALAVAAKLDRADPGPVADAAAIAARLGRARQAAKLWAKAAARAKRGGDAAARARLELLAARAWLDAGQARRAARVLEATPPVGPVALEALELRALLARVQGKREEADRAWSQLLATWRAQPHRDRQRAFARDRVRRGPWTIFVSERPDAGGQRFERMGFRVRDERGAPVARLSLVRDGALLDRGAEYALTMFVGGGHPGRLTVRVDTGLYFSEPPDYPILLSLVERLLDQHLGGQLPGKAGPTEGEAGGG